MATFNKLVEDWFCKYIECHEDDEEHMLDLFNMLVDREDGDTIDYWVGENGTVTGYMLALNGETVWKKLLVPNATMYAPIRPLKEDTGDIVKGLLESIEKEAGLDQYDFVPDIIEDIAYNITGYDSPKGFFMDLANNGCSSGMGMFRYRDECKKFYVDHMDDIDCLIEQVEGELGEPLRNTNHWPRCIFVCQFTYEETANMLAKVLFPDDF